MFALTLRNLTAHRRRLVATIASIVLGVGFMTGTLVLTDTIGRTFDQLFADANDGVDAYVRAESAIDADPMMGANRPRLDADIEQRVMAVDGVAATAPDVQGYAEIVTDSDRQDDTPKLGHNWITVATLNPFTIADGRPPADADEIVIDRGTANSHDIGVDDTVQVATNHGVHDAKVVGIATFGVADRPGNASFVFFETETAQERLAEPGRIDAVRIAADPGVTQDELVARVADAVGNRLEVLTGEELTAEDQDDVAEQLAFFNTFLLTFAAISLVVGSFIIANTFSILVAQRTREIALLRAIGATRRQILIATVGEAGLVGIAASLLGVGGGVGLAAALKSLLSAFDVDLPGGGLVIAPSTVAIGVFIGTAITVAAAVQPARAAARVAPIAAMRQTTIDANRGRLRSVGGALATIAGSALVSTTLADDRDIATVGAGIALAFVGVIAIGPAFAAPIVKTLGYPIARGRGLAGTLARQNAIRNPHRTAATASALTVGVAVVAAMTVLGASVNASIDAAVSGGLRADVVVDAGMFATNGLSPALAADIAALPAAATSTTTRSAQVEVGGDTVAITAIDPGAYPNVVDLGDIDGAFGDLGSTELAVQRDIAQQHGWDIGEHVTVTFAETGRHRFTIGAVYDNGQLAGDYLIGLSTFEQHVADQVDTQILVDAAEGSSVGELRDAVARVAGRFPNARVQDRDEFTGSLTGHIDEMLNLVGALLLLAVIIALIGIANTLSLAIIERTRELGLLRAVGMSRRQLRATVRLEALLVSLLGATIGVTTGVGAGSALAAALADQGIDHLAVPAGRIALITLVAATAGVVAAARPARRAARLDVLAAVATS